MIILYEQENNFQIQLHKIEPFHWVVSLLKSKELRNKLWNKNNPTETQIPFL